MKKLITAILISLFCLSAWGITISELRSVRNNDIRIEYLSAIISWAKDLRSEIQEEQKVIEALQKKGLLNQTQATTILSEYESVIQTKFQARPTLQTVVDAYNARKIREEQDRLILDEN